MEDQARPCRDSVDVNPRAAEELRQMESSSRSVVPILEYGTFDDGPYHIGKGDCTHYCQPGVPDLTALRLLRAVAGLSEQHREAATPK